MAVRTMPPRLVRLLDHAVALRLAVQILPGDTDLSVFFRRTLSESVPLVRVAWRWESDPSGGRWRFHRASSTAIGGDRAAQTIPLGHVLDELGGLAR